MPSIRLAQNLAADIGALDFDVEADTQPEGCGPFVDSDASESEVFERLPGGSGIVPRPRAFVRSEPARPREVNQSGYPPPRVFVHHELIAAMRELYAEGEGETALFLAGIIASELGIVEEAPRSLGSCPPTSFQDVDESGPRRKLPPHS